MKFLDKLSLEHFSLKQLNTLAVLCGGVALLAIIAVNMQEGTTLLTRTTEAEQAVVDPLANTASMRWAASNNGGNMSSWGDGDGPNAAQNGGNNPDGWPAPRGCKLGPKSEDICVKDGPEKYRIFGVFSIHEVGNKSNGKKAYFVARAPNVNRHSVPNWGNSWNVNVHEPNKTLEIPADSKIELQWVCQDKQINYFQDECGLFGTKMCEDKNEILLFNDSNGKGAGFNAGSRRGEVTITPPYGTTNYRLRCLAASGQHGPLLNINVNRAQPGAVDPPVPPDPPTVPEGVGGIYTPTPTVSEATPHAGHFIVQSNTTVPIGLHAVINLEFTGTATRNVDYVATDNLWTSTWNGTGDSVIMDGGQNRTFVRVYTPQDNTNESAETITARIVGFNVYLGSIPVPSTFFPPFTMTQDRDTITIAADSAGPPTITTNPATNVTTTGAILNGAGNPNSNATIGWFRYSLTNPGTCNDTFGTRTPATGGIPLGAGATSVAFSSPIAGLTNGATYYYCAIGSNSGGTRFGSIRTFIPGTPTTIPVPGSTDVCTDIPGDQGSRPTSCTGPVPTCVGAGQELSGTQCVNLPTIVEFYADPSRVQPNPEEFTTLHWTIDNFAADQCRIEANPQDRITPQSYPVTSATGSKQTEIISQTTQFTLICGSADSQQVTVTVVPIIIEI